ncbi:COX15/CtaA family protein [Brachybacterium aquaticum]|uniref:Cytochrome c oxidase assembly protein subunit 15 n=1 Tax=Brachybacterium aquaticum TaxID=1432564 RepID=A0A841A8N8_9MICO|nr:COX15/CtaA family protein [Brachybacterium aquaticum]MBB5831589.1 cytochrome c oxidase assembly protein subunit 15 [Brachybacterium aquaticum]
MSSPALAPAARTPERHGRITTLPDARLTSWGPQRRARLAAIALWGNLICQMGIILSGGAVRLTGSGLGCSTWPNCEPGQFTPVLTMESGIHPFVEFGNRTLTGVLSIFAIAVLVVTYRWLSHKGRGFRMLAWVPLIGTALQALIGAFVVWLDLHPGLVSPHFLISPVIGALSTVLLVRLYDGDGRVRLAVPGKVLGLYVALAVVGFVVLVLGTIVTGTGPHSGDSGDITRIMLDPVVISRVHAMAVYAFLALLIALLVVLHRLRARREASTAAWALLALTLAQGMVGYIQYFTGLPAGMVFAHLIGAALFAPAIAWVGARLVTWQEQR